MQTLTFNTTLRTVQVVDENKIVFSSDNVPTVKIGEGFYEVMVEGEEYESESGTKKTRYPVARFPIAATNMVIKK